MSAARPRKIHPATIASVLAIVLLGVGWGLAMQRSAKLDATRALESELSEEAYDDYLASKARPPRSALTLTASAFVLVSLFCLTYELLRGALRHALKAGVGKIAWLRVSRPDATTAEAVRQSKWPRVIGKILFIAVVSLLWASQNEHRTAERLEAARVAAVDREAGSPQEENAPPPAVPPNHLLTGIFGSALCVGAYEFAGVFAAVSGVDRFIKAIPVPCPECGGKAFQTNGKPIVYECRECRHVLRR